LLAVLLHHLLLLRVLFLQGAVVAGHIKLQGKKMVVAAVVVAAGHIKMELEAQVIHHQHPQVKVVMEALVQRQTVTVVLAVAVAQVLPVALVQELWEEREEMEPLLQ
jgi:hypothetical protein